MSNCLMNSAVNSEMWAFQTHRSIMRVRLASFCRAKYRTVALHIPAGSGKTRGQKLILHTSECKKISRTQIRFGSSSRLDAVHSSIGQAQRRKKECDNRYNVQTVKLWNQHYQHYHYQPLKSALHRVNRIVRDTSMIFTSVQNGAVQLLHRYTTDACQTSNTKVRCNSFKLFFILTGKDRHNRQAHAGRSD